MLKVFTAEQIRQWDTFTIENEPISPEGLMDRACIAFVNWFTEKFNTREKIAIVCGKGNNGGDGLVISKKLSAVNYDVTVFKVGDNIRLEPFTVVIDAIFGSGLS